MPDKVDCSELAAAIARLALHIGEDPSVRTLDDVAREMAADIPEIRRSDIVDALNEVADSRARTSSDLQRHLSRLRREARNDRALRRAAARLRSHLAAGTRPPKPPRGGPAPREIADLQSEVGELKRRLKDSDPETRTKLQGRIDELERHIADGTMPAPRPPRRPAPADVQALRDRRDELMAALRQSEPAIRRRYETQIAEMTARLEASDFAPPAPRPPKKLSREMERLQFERDKLRRRINERVAELRPRSFWVRAATAAAEPFNIARAIMTSYDFSAVLRQGGVLSAANPALAAKAIPDMFRAFASEEAATRAANAIEARPNAPMYARSKLYIAPLDGPLNSREEQFLSRLAGKIPGVGASQRAYVTFLNRLRADTFDALEETLVARGGGTAEEMRSIASFINISTGRGGGVKKLDEAAVALSSILFSPRLLMSRFQLLAGQPILGASSGAARRLIAEQYAKAAAGAGLFLALGVLGGGTVLLDDPTSSDFGKLRIGNTRIDPWAGLQQVAVFLSREARAVSNTARGIKNPRGRDGLSVAGRFARSKLSPGAGFVADMAAGTDFRGDPVTPGGQAKKLLVPMSFQEIVPIMEEHGIAKGTAIVLAQMAGMGVQNYDDKPKR